MAIGTVKWFNATKGFGLIVPQDGGEDVFVNIAAVEAAGLQGLNQGQKVSYELQDARAPLRHITAFQATAVRGLNEGQMVGYEPDETPALLRALALPWEEAHDLAVHYAAETVGTMRANFNEYAGRHDPYGTGDSALDCPRETHDADDPTVQGMAEAFISILNRRGLVRIDAD